MEINFSLADSELDSYLYSSESNTLELKIKLWNDKLILFSFTDPIFHTDRFRNEFLDFIVVEEPTQLLSETLESVYETVPADHPYKLYCFLDLNKLPSIEIIARDLHIVEMLISKKQ